MKTAYTLICGLVITQSLSAQSLVNGTNYSDLYGGTPTAVTVNPSVNPGIIADVAIGGTTGPTPLALGTYWTASATGGTSLGALGIPVATSGSQVRLVGNTLEFGLAKSGLLGNQNTLLGNLVNLGLNVTSTWHATATFDKAGNELILAPNTTYQISFNVNGHNGFLDNSLGLGSSFSIEFLDGAGANVGQAGNTSPISLLGILDTGVDTGTITLNFTTGNTVNTTDAASIRFNGAAVLSPTALGIDSPYATISGLNITAVPEPSAFGLISLGALGLLRRKR